MNDKMDLLSTSIHAYQTSNINKLFASALFEFWDAFSSESTLTFANIAYSPKSPGRIFQLDEDTLVEYLDRLDNLTKGALRYDETAGVKQVYRQRQVEPMKLLNSYYQSIPSTY